MLGECGLQHVRMRSTCDIICGLAPMTRDPLPPPEQRRADLAQLMRRYDPIPPPPPTDEQAAEQERQSRREAFDRSEDRMGIFGAIAVFALTVFTVRFWFGSFLGGLVLGLLWAGLVYAVAGWQTEKRRHQRTLRAELARRSRDHAA
jgi:hypothetical protein